MDLDAFIGKWSMEAQFPGAPPTGPLGRTVFEWLAGEQFLIQRWEVLPPSAPDGIAIIGLDSDSETYSQHYFDSRGVARVYAMTFSDGVWELSRDTRDFSPLSFSQRFTGSSATMARPSMAAGELQRRLELGARLRPVLHEDK